MHHLITKDPKTFQRSILTILLSCRNWKKWDFTFMYLMLEKLIQSIATTF